MAPPIPARALSAKALSDKEALLRGEVSAKEEEADLVKGVVPLRHPRAATDVPAAGLRSSRADAATTEEPVTPALTVFRTAPVAAVGDREDHQEGEGEGITGAEEGAGNLVHMGHTVEELEKGDMIWLDEKGVLTEAEATGSRVDPAIVIFREKASERI